MLFYIACVLAAWLIYHQVRWYLAKPDFSGKTVLITGASSGIGEEIAKQISKLGTKKLILSSRRIAELERVKKECLAAGSKSEIQVLPLDLSDPDECLKWAQAFT